MVASGNQYIGNFPKIFFTPAPLRKRSKDLIVFVCQMLSEAWFHMNHEAETTLYGFGIPDYRTVLISTLLK